MCVKPSHSPTVQMLTALAAPPSRVVTLSGPNSDGPAATMSVSAVARARTL
jgi:hypothetical protein